VFYRKFITYVLLTLYGVPAAIGPHWHSHHTCGVACASACTSPHDAWPADTSNQCSCNHDHSTSCDERNHDTNLPCIVGSDSDNESCAVCHFYSSTPFAGVAFSIAERGSLVELLMIAPYGQLCHLDQLHLARGPPSGSAQLNPTR
jgi:hypothetical protein